MSDSNPTKYQPEEDYDHILLSMIINGARKEHDVHLRTIEFFEHDPKTFKIVVNDSMQLIVDYDTQAMSAFLIDYFGESLKPPGRLLPPQKFIIETLFELGVQHILLTFRSDHEINVDMFTHKLLNDGITLRGSRVHQEDDYPLIITIRGMQRELTEHIQTEIAAIPEHDRALIVGNNYMLSANINTQFVKGMIVEVMSINIRGDFAIKNAYRQFGNFGFAYSTCLRPVPLTLADVDVNQQMKTIDLGQPVNIKLTDKGIQYAIRLQNLGRLRNCKIDGTNIQTFLYDFYFDYLIDLSEKERKDCVGSYQITQHILMLK